MTKITIPVSSAKIGGPLHDLVYNKAILNSQVSSTDVGSVKTIEASDQILALTESEIIDILNAGGEVENYLFGIRAPLSSANINVPVGVPLRTNKVGDVKNFKDWFLPSSEVWKNTVLNELIYYNNPNPSGSPNLLASEADIIRQIDTGTYSFLTVAEVQAIIVDTNWVKL